MGLFFDVGWVKRLCATQRGLLGRWHAGSREGLTQPTPPLRSTIVLALVAVLAITPAFAVEPDEILPDAKLETRARALSAELRCLVCQNQSIDDSNAPLARDLRLLVRERLTAGDSDEVVMSFIVARYGQFVLLRPPFQLSTLLLWLGPPGLLLATLTLLLMKSRRDRLAAPSMTGAQTATGSAGAAAASALSPQEEARLKALTKPEPRSS